MIKKEFVETRDDGIKLYRTYSDGEFFIKKNGADVFYTEAIDVENSGYTYTETDIPIEGDTDELTVDDTLQMLNQLGVDIDDQSSGTRKARHCPQA